MFNRQMMHGQSCSGYRPLVVDSKEILTRKGCTAWELKLLPLMQVQIHNLLWPCWSCYECHAQWNTFILRYSPKRILRHPRKVSPFEATNPFACCWNIPREGCIARFLQSHLLHYEFIHYEWHYEWVHTLWVHTKTLSLVLTTAL